MKILLMVLALMINKEKKEFLRFAFVYQSEMSLRSFDEGESNKNDSALCSVYNGLGLYASNVQKDYYRSLTYFFKGVEAARRCHYDRLYSILLSNIAGIYYLKNDSTGLKYALECYELGHERKDPYLIYSGSTNTAYMYYLKSDYNTALKYIQEAEFTMVQNDFL